MRSIRGRILVLLMLGLTVVLTAGGAGVYWVAASGMLHQLDTGLESRARTLSSLVTYERRALHFDSDDAAEMLGGTFYEIRTLSGEVLKRSGNLASTPLPTREMTEGDLVFGDADLPEAANGRVAWLAFRPRIDHDEDDEDEGRPPPPPPPPGEPEVLIAAAAIDRGPVDRALGTLLGALFAVGGIVGITSGALIAIGVPWGLRPLDRLSAALGDVSGRTLSRRVDGTGGPRELLPIHRELNRMLDRVETALDRERSFVDAAAHELRTPLAELRATAEVAIRWPDAERVTAALRELLAIGGEMESLVDSLLLISRGEANAPELGGERVPVGTIVSSCLERANGSISRKRLDLKVDLAADHALRAPRNGGEIIIRNLIANAVQYTPDAGTISIRNGTADDATDDMGSPSLLVENGPVELGEEDVSRLFEPFWRTERARSDRTHVGLGLTVVRRVAKAIGLRVDARLCGDRLQMRVSPAP